MSSEKIFHWRHLPHYYPENSIFFITFCLTYSLPRNVIEQLKELRDQMKKESSRNWEHRFIDYEKALEKFSNKIHWLRDERIASIVDEAIKYRDNKDYTLMASTIMPNHVHLIFGIGLHELYDVGQTDSLSKTSGQISNLSNCDSLSKSNGQINNLSNKSISKIMQSLKRHTGRKANEILERTGQFWQDECYDHVIRDAEELERLIFYVLYNPVNAGLVKNWHDWKWSYCKPEFEI